MKHLYLLFIFVLSMTSVYPQLIQNDWRTPKALSDSSSDNLNAFLLSNGSNPTVVWQKVINENTTALYMKSINDSTDVEHLVLQTDGNQYKNPTGFEIEQYAYSYKVIVFEAVHNTNQKQLEFVIISDDSISEPMKITDLSDAETRPVSSENDIIWLNDSSVMASHFDQVTKTFTSPAVLINDGVYSLRNMSQGSMMYFNKIGNKTAKVNKYFYFYENTWHINLNDSVVVEGTLDNLGGAESFFNCGSWCAEVRAGAYAGSIIFNDIWSIPSYLTSEYIQLEPTIDGLMIFVDGLNSLSFFAYASDSLGQYEILAHQPVMEGFVNISQNPGGEDRNPELYQTFLDFITNREFLIWESERQGNKTIYYTSIDYLIGANKKLDSGININISPNPLSTQTTISFPIMQNPVVKIYSMEGKEIRNLNGFVYSNSNQQVIWDGKDGFGRTVPAGNYVVVVQGDKGMISKVIVKQ